MSKTVDVYVSGGLSDLPADVRPKFIRFYEDIGKVVESLGLTAYIPHLNTDPIRHKDVTPEQVDLIDRTAVTYSKLVIAVADNPALGVGIEVEMANHAAKPVVLVFHRDLMDQRRISRLVRGNPAVIQEIVYNEFEEALVLIESFLHSFLESQETSVLPTCLQCRAS